MHWLQPLRNTNAQDVTCEQQTGRSRQCRRRRRGVGSDVRARESAVRVLRAGSATQRHALVLGVAVVA